jgi:hypothetical protein
MIRLIVAKPTRVCAAAGLIRPEAAGGQRRVITGGHVKLI